MYRRVRIGDATAMAREESARLCSKRQVSPTPTAGSKSSVSPWRQSRLQWNWAGVSEGLPVSTLQNTADFDEPTRDSSIGHCPDSQNLCPVFQR